MHVHTIEVQDGPAIIHRQPTIGDTFDGVVKQFKKNGVVQDVSADTFELVIKDENGDTQETLTVGSGITFDGDGIKWRVSDTDTATWTNNATWTYHLKWTQDSDGTVKTVIAGNLIPRSYP